MKVLTKYMLILVLFASCTIGATWSDTLKTSGISNQTTISDQTAYPSEIPASSPSASSGIQVLRAVGISDDYPLMFINRNGLPDGLAVEVLRSFSESAGYKLELDLLSPDQIATLYSQEYDLYYDGGRIDRPDGVRLTIPFYIRDYTLFVDQRLDQSMNFRDLFLDDTGKLSIGYRSSVTVSKYLNMAAKNNTLIALPNHDDALNGLIENQFDAVFMPSEIGKLLLTDRQMSASLKPIDTTFLLEENNFVVHSDHILLQFELNNYIQALKKSGSLEHITQKWISLPEPRSGNRDILSLFNYFFFISAAATFAFSYRSYHLERNVEKQANVLNQLNHANEELWTALIDEERYKNEYYINLSHELRTPISLILNAVNAVERTAPIKSRDYPDDKFVKYTGIAKNNSMRLLRVINNLIDANHLENKDYTLDLKYVDLVYELNELIKSIFEVLDPNELELSLTTDLQALDAVIDPYELDRILLNLISNSMKFNENKPKIQLSLNLDHQMIQLDYSDNSIGIPKTLVQTAFLKYHQLDADFAKKSEGAGFGLYLSKQLVELHNGTLSPMYASDRSGMHYRLEIPTKQPENHGKPSSGKSLFYDRGRLVRLELSEIRTLNRS